MLNQQSNNNGMSQFGQQGSKGCPAMCARWDTVLKPNGQMENTPVVMSPMMPGDTNTQCPKQCEPRCCNAAGQAYQPAAQTQASVGLQDLQADAGANRPPACMASCPKACYPACRTACCNGPQQMEMYQQMLERQASMTQRAQQPYAPQPAWPAQTRETIPRPASASYDPAQGRDAVAPYPYPQSSSVRSSIPAYPTMEYTYPQSPMTSQTRETIPQPVSSDAAGQPAQRRTNVPKHTASVKAETCPIPCSPMCAPHCTKKCCESYD